MERLAVAHPMYSASDGAAMGGYCQSLSSRRHRGAAEHLQALSHSGAGDRLDDNALRTDLGAATLHHQLDVGHAGSGSDRRRLGQLDTGQLEVGGDPVSQLIEPAQGDITREGPRGTELERLDVSVGLAEGQQDTHVRLLEIFGSGLLPRSSEPTAFYTDD
ncbi:MAG TPA: hypothetical protein VJM32_03615 [Candidatus Saccharimonadales bacterium]|nr:hypothetical protein [Candidatus Saccharimonadales bacterium]